MATVKFKDATLTLLGNDVKAGESAPDFKVQKSIGFVRLDQAHFLE